MCPDNVHALKCLRSSLSVLKSPLYCVRFEEYPTKNKELKDILHCIVDKKCRDDNFENLCLLLFQITSDCKNYENISHNNLREKSTFVPVKISE